MQVRKQQQNISQISLKMEISKYKLTTDYLCNKPKLEYSEVFKICILLNEPVLAATPLQHSKFHFL